MSLSYPTHSARWYSPVGGIDSPVPYSTWRKWFFYFPIDREGIPTSDPAYQVLQHLFAGRREAHSPEEIAEKLLLHRELVRCMCRQFEVVDLVTEEPAGSSRYRYRLDSENVELQRQVEIALLDYPLRSAELKRPPLPPA
jgi:hypothetical protein